MPSCLFRKKARLFYFNNPAIRLSISSLLFCLFAGRLMAQSPASLTLRLDTPGTVVSPNLYGLMTEEINYSYDGGLYAELIRNRTFKDDPPNPDHWSVIAEGDSKAAIALDRQQPINDALTVCLRLEVDKAGRRTGIANDGYWGIPVKPQTAYRASFYARTSDANPAPVTVSIENRDGSVLFASATVTLAPGGWQRYTASLTTAAGIQPTADTRFVISTRQPGTYWFNLVSLFPPTYNDRPNGNRADIMQLLAGMKPGFLRFPGGNYLEGDLFSTRFPWKKTLGSLEDRPGHLGCWSYRSSDGMGLLEFLEWCEDIHMEPLLAVFAGYVLKKDYLEAGPLLQPFVDDALEEIEYVTGDTTTVWGKRRAKDGHPAPFPLRYIEVGNEDGFDASGSYDGRFAQFYDAIKAKYPSLQVISTAGGKDGLGRRVKLTSRRPDAIDEHYYRNSWEMEEDAAHYDNYSRTGPKIFVGEWATREGSPTPNLNAALGDAAWMTGMERNSDVVVMSCYAPLFVNVNPGGMQWKSDLIGYDALTSYGSPSYYAQKMFNVYRGDNVVPITAAGIPTRNRLLSARDSAAGMQPRQIPVLFYVATRNTVTGTLFLKIVNAGGQPQTVKIDIKGAGKILPGGQSVVLKGDGPEETNSITAPEKIVPVASKVTGLGKSFTRSFPAWSITVLQIETKSK
jgi:alpha-N-arabinofuranosidase